MFTEQQQKLRESDNVKIVRTFTCSPYVCETGSDIRRPNPEYHQPICQREDGKFCDVEGRLIPMADVPSYIKDSGKPQKATPEPGRRNMKLSEVMAEATNANTSADRVMPRKRAARTRK